MFCIFVLFFYSIFMPTTKFMSLFSYVIYLSVKDIYFNSIVINLLKKLKHSYKKCLKFIIRVFYFLFAKHNY